MELHIKYRPRSFKQMVGQEEVVNGMSGWKGPEDIPHVLMLHGNTGTGKTTAADILCRRLKVAEGDRYDINCASSRGIDTVREVLNSIESGPLYGGPTRVWVWDECHRLTPDAQSAFLTATEKMPKHAYFIFSTTDLDKILTALRGRCTKFKFELVKRKDMMYLLRSVAEKEGIELASNKVYDAILDFAAGVPREALNQLGKVAAYKSEQDQLNAIVADELQAQAIELARAMMFQPKWDTVADILKRLDGEEPMKLRGLILSYAGSVILNNKKGPKTDRANLVLLAFGDPIYDKYGIYRASYEVCTS